MSEDKKQKLVDSYVTYYVFFWILGILMSGITFSVAIAMSAKADVGTVNNKVDSQTTDIQWIKTTLSEIKDDIKDLK